MSIEIERKFLVTSSAYRHGKSEVLCQGYLVAQKERTVRVRMQGKQAKLTIKGPSVSFTRSEFEYDIPLADAQALLQLCEKPLIEKTRYYVAFAGHTWEVDEFHGANQGLVVAEIELKSEDETFEKPPWIGQEVTYDRRYSNANLVTHPYANWIYA